MKLIKKGRFWAVLGTNNKCFYMSINMIEALEKLSQLKEVKK